MSRSICKSSICWNDATIQVSQLSMEQQHRLSIARALVSNPKILLLDDPFALLPEKPRAALQTLVAAVQQRFELTTLMVTNNLDEALILNDRAVLMTSSQEAAIGSIVRIDLPRPRMYSDLLELPTYHHVRRQIAAFLDEESRKVAA
ncbi:MAG: ATP-binding cassette domain-containing protein [Pirellulaceae bacterium]